MDERAGGENDLAVGDVASDFDHCHTAGLMGAKAEGGGRGFHCIPLVFTNIQG